MLDNLLRQYLQATAVSLALACLLSFLQNNFTARDTGIVGGYIILLLVGYRLLKTKQSMWLAHGFTAVFWLAITATLFTFGIKQLPNPGAYIVIILIALILLRARTTFIYFILSSIAVSLLMLASQLGRIPVIPVTQRNTAYLLKSLPQAFLTFSILGYTYFTLRFILDTLHFNEQTLQQIRYTLGQRTADLSASNAQLRHEVQERQQAEANLERQRAFLRNIIDSIPNFVSVKNTNGRYLLVNKAFATLYTATPSQIEGQTVQQINNHRENVFTQFAEGDRRVLDTLEEIYWPEMPFIDPTNKQRWLHVVKRPLLDPTTNEHNIITVSTDITLEKTTTESLREKETNFRTLVEASFEGIIICINHVIQEANLSFATMFGYTAVTDVLGKNASEFLATDDVATLKDNLNQSQKTSLEVVGVRQDKTTFPAELVTHTINYQGQKAQITGYRDITLRKQAEEAEQHAQKLESLSLMAGGLAHDFNNLLVAMMGQMAIAKAKIEPNHPGQSNLDKAIQATETAAMLTRQLLAYTGQGHFEVTTIQLNRLIAQNLQLFQDALPPNITFHTNLYEPLPHILADGVQIQQVIMNLLLNAAEALGTQPGTITINTAPYQLTQKNLPQWQPHNDTITPGAFVLLEMNDTGRGMDEDTLNRIFDPFFSTKGTGRGLGLAAVMGIVRGHGGGVHASSQPGTGTTFQFIFPQEEAEETDLETAVPNQLNQQDTVLIIDDETAVREAVSDILDLEAIPALTAASGQEGIDVFTAKQHQIGLIILDLSMPGMSGIEAFDLLRQVDPAAKIILSSGYTEAEILEKMAGTRPTGFLQKPYRLDTVLQIVQKHLSP
ncbi:MAG: PAS domain S-box protein [Anaerolineales bacterium]|nr:PAS domain S-box protein [Anaerolineales bacterium]